MSNNKTPTKINLSNEKDLKFRETFFEKFRSNNLSIAMLPTWVAIILMTLYFIFKPWVDSKLDYGVLFTISGLAIIFTAFIAIRIKKYPGWFSLHTGPAAINLGWLTLIPGIFVLIKGVLLVLQNL